MGIHTAEHQNSAAENLREKAESYLDHEIHMGLVRASRLFRDGHLNKFAGHTETETMSGVTIRKLSNGDLIVSGEYAIADEGGQPYDATLQAELIASSHPVVTERRDGTNEKKHRAETLDREAGEHAMKLLAHTIDEYYGIGDGTDPVPEIDVTLLHTPEGLRKLR